jgi:integrase
VKTVRRGRQVKINLGRVGKLTARQARGKARALLTELLADGVPEKPKAVVGQTFFDYAEAFWADYARHWKPATQRTNRALIDKVLAPTFGHLTINRISRADVQRWRDAMSARPGVFNRAVPVLAVMMTYAEPMGLRPRGSNPCKGIARYKRPAKERFLSPTEYRRLGQVLRAFEPAAPDMVALVRLLILTGARCGEIASLRWEDVHPPRLRLPDSKTGPKFVYLNSAAERILEARRADARTAWVFPAPGGAGPIGYLPAKWVPIRKAAALPDLRLHDLRHSFASVAIKEGVPLFMISRLLGHALPETTARYAHLDDGAVSDAAARVSGSLAAALRGGADPEAA